MFLKHHYMDYKQPQHTHLVSGADWSHVIVQNILNSWVSMRGVG